MSKCSCAYWVKIISSKCWHYRKLIWRKFTTSGLRPREHLAEPVTSLLPIAVASQGHVIWAHFTDGVFCFRWKLFVETILLIFLTYSCLVAPWWIRTKLVVCPGWNRQNLPFWRGLKMMLATKKAPLLTQRYVLYVVWLMGIVEGSSHDGLVHFNENVLNITWTVAM